MLTFRKNLILSLFQWPLFLEFFSHLLCRLCVFKHEFKKKMTFFFPLKRKLKAEWEEQQRKEREEEEQRQQEKREREVTSIVGG